MPPSYGNAHKHWRESAAAAVLRLANKPGPLAKDRRKTLAVFADTLELLERCEKTLRGLAEGGCMFH